jgi:indole-3-glycerol phosphate synthase
VAETGDDVSVGTYLDAILDHHRLRSAADARDLGALISDSQDAPPVRGFRDAIMATEGIAVIAEIKRRSPSKGDLFVSLDPVEVAAQYEAGGASCMSVLTDEDHFGGSADDLRAARAAVSMPVIRKDFTVDLRDICDARLMGADCVLLIVSALDDAQLADFHALAAELGLDALVETHDEDEVERALAVGATLVGVNQRDLFTFQVDQERAVRVAASLPDGVVRVAESGVRGVDDARVLAAAGYHAVLVGESLVTSGDPTRAVRSLRS